MTGLWRLRAAVLTLVGVLAVHQARFRFAPAEHEHGLAAAHVYLPWLTAAAAVLLFLTATHLAASVARATGVGAARLPQGRTLWLLATGSLLSVFALQESAETYIAHGHVPGMAELLADGGWTALPFSVVVGGLIAIALRGAASVVRWACARRRARPRRRPARRVPRHTAVLAPRGSLLARRMAGRGPPVLS